MYHVFPYVHINIHVHTVRQYRWSHGGWLDKQLQWKCWHAPEKSQVPTWTDRWRAPGAGSLLSSHLRPAPGDWQENKGVPTHNLLGKPKNKAQICLLQSPLFGLLEGVTFTLALDRNCSGLEKNQIPGQGDYDPNTTWSPSAPAVQAQGNKVSKEFAALLHLCDYVFGSQVQVLKIREQRNRHSKTGLLLECD